MTVTLTDYVRHAVRHLHPCICLAPLIPAASAGPDRDTDGLRG